MSLRVADELAPLLSPVRRVVDAALAGVDVDLEVGVGEVAGFGRLEGTRLVLSRSLLEGPVHHPEEGPLPLDRWRRAAACVIEAGLLQHIATRVGEEPVDDWRWVGLAAELADALAPELRVADSDLARALAGSGPSHDPRSGVAWWRWVRLQGDDPLERGVDLLRGGIVSSTEWLGLVRWLHDPAGAAARLPVLVDRVREVRLPWRPGPWSWASARVDGAQVGWRIESEGSAAAEPRWVAAGAQVTVLLANADGQGSVDLVASGPVGRWRVASAEGMGQVMGARGIEWCFHEDGRLEIVLSDAFVGPLAALPVAEQMGTSGTVVGRWSLEGPATLRFAGVDTSSLTVHGRRSDRFRMPAGGFGMGEWLRELGASPWSFSVSSDRLVVRGSMRGAPVEVRFRDADPSDA